MNYNTVFFSKVVGHETSYRETLPQFLLLKRREIGPTCSLDFERIVKLIGKHRDALVKSVFPPGIPQDRIHGGY